MIIDPKFLRDSTHLLYAMSTLPPLEEIREGSKRCDRAPTAVRVELITEVIKSGYALTYRALDRDGFIVQQHIRMVITDEYVVSTEQGKVGGT